MTVITRFAPSPTGLIHVGNTRTALICYLFAKSHGGQFMLRIDDTDTERSKDEYIQQIQEDLKWLGLDWNIYSRQSERTARYEEIKQKLVADGRLYPCYETPQEIEIKRKMLLNQGKPPIYDRSALKLTDADHKKFKAEGRPPHWRFKLDESKPIQWHDLIKGHIHFEASNLSDPVLIRENGMPTYMLPSAIDDMDYNITHIVRGEDHVSNTAIQIQLFEAIGGSIPHFAHHSLMKSKDGKISKRDGGFDIGALRRDGIEPMAITSFLARLGTSQPVEARTTLGELAEHFDLNHFSRAAAIYDFTELERLNPKVLHLYSYNQVKDTPELKAINEEFWLSVRSNLTRLADIREWWAICKEPLSPVIEKNDSDFTQKASTLLPEGKWDENTWGMWIEAVKKATGRKGKELFMPLRKALTARESGPELKDILPLIGKEKAISRLNGREA